VVIFESLFMAQYLPFVKGYSKALMILREHNVEYKIWETLSQLEKNPIKKWYLQLLSKRMYDEEKTALNAFDALTTVTKEDKQELQKMGCNKLIHVAPFCIDVDALKMMPSSDANVQSVFHIGSMEWMPNCEAMKWFLEKVWPRVTDKIATAHFYMAGRGMPASFHQYNSESVHVVGEVEDAYEFMSKHQVMIVPLFSGSGIRVKILEAMALGKSIVSTNLGMAGIDCISSVHACLANNADEFAQAIIDLLSYNEKSKQMGLEAQKLIQEKYTLSKVISQTLDFYQMVASSSGK
jgi:glycosyltransferase involved in cell wall biosynthesis